MKSDIESWVQAALALVRSEQAAMLVSIVGVQGSSPREPGAHMLVSPDSAVGSVGGGVLEHMAIQRARADLREQDRERRLISFPLDPDSQQCCGGIVVLLFEPLHIADLQWLESLSLEAINEGILLVTSLNDHSSAKRVILGEDLADLNVPDAIHQWQGDRTGSDACLIDDQGEQLLCEWLVSPHFNVLLFGAGHVGRALVTALAPHQCQVDWVDSREQEFPVDIPFNVSVHISADNPALIAAAPAGSFVLAMTHRHPLDFEICQHALARGDFAWVGLIGSATKRRRFVRAMDRAGLDNSLVARLCCPIGVPGIHGKQPQVIAASVVAQLLQLVETGGELAVRRLGISEKQAEASAISSVF